MIRPNQIPSYPEIDLKLGIKSSLPHIKSTMALLILLWKCTNRPATLSYSEQAGEGTVLKKELMELLYEYSRDYIGEEHMDRDQFTILVNSNQLMTSQLESLMVAFELVWKIAKINFQESHRPASAERTGGVRYPKYVTYALPLDLLQLLMKDREEEYIRVLLHWLGTELEYSIQIEETLLETLTILSEGAVFKLNNQGNDIIFNQSSIYQQLLNRAEEVDISGDKEAKGSLRILKSLLSDEMNPYLTYRGGMVMVAKNKKEELKAYQQRVETFLSISTPKVIANEESRRETTKIHQLGIFDDQGEVISEVGQQTIELLTNSSGETSEGTPSVWEIPNRELTMENQREILVQQVRHPREQDLHPLNQIIFGAPGTGKTYSSAEYALAIIENRNVDLRKKSKEERKEVMRQYESFVKAGQIVFTTFHQSYGYEEFIQGIRPDSTQGTVQFKKEDGVFKKIADRAFLDPDNPYIIIIDEINRGNISKIFGELITLIEEDKRYGELNQLSVTLPMGDVFAVPNNLYIIGTMNSADKSISLIDTAIRRRFSFIEMAPDESIIENEVLRNVLLSLNTYLKKELRSTDLLIGHSFFMGKKESSLEDIMNRNIIPLLYEYFYEDEAKVKKALECLHGTNCVLDSEYRGRIRVVKKD